MPEIELDDDAAAKTLAEHMADELAAERNKYDALLAADFVKSIILYARDQADRAKEQALRSLDPADRARFKAWESLSNGTFFLGALEWRYWNIKREYQAIERIRELETKSAARKSDRHGNAPGEYGLYNTGGNHPSRDEQTRG